MEINLYERLADQITDQIKSGLFQPGDRLPSVRKLADREAVSVSTVMATYELLEQRRLVMARPKSGYYVQNRRHESLAEPRPCCPPTRPVPANVSQLMMDTLNVSALGGVNLFTAYPAMNMPIGQQLRRAFGRLARTEQYLGVGYGPLEGEPALRKQIAMRSLDAGVSVSADDLIITSGCQHALSLALRVLTKPGDVIAVESPCYYGFIQMIEAYGLKAIEIPAHPEDGMSLEALQLAFNQWPIKAILTVPTFSNPMGCSMPPHRRQALVALLERYDIPLIEDDIYGDLSFSHQRIKAVKAFDPNGHVLLCSSLSKTIDPLLRIGWILPGRYYSAILHQKFITTLSLPVLPQLAAAEVMSRGAYDRHLRLARDHYYGRVSLLADLIAQHFPPDTGVSRPQGGIALWVELPRQVDATQLYYRARQEGIHFAPGELFAMDARFQNCMRLIYAQEWTAQRVRAVILLGQWASEAAAQPSSTHAVSA